MDSKMSTDGIPNLGYLNGEDSSNTEGVQTSGGDIANHQNKNFMVDEVDVAQPLPPADAEAEYINPNYPVVDVLGADILTKPFSIVAGSAKISHTKFSPFRKKSGMLNVLKKQAKVYPVNQISCWVSMSTPPLDNDNMYHIYL